MNIIQKIVARRSLAAAVTAVVGVAGSSLLPHSGRPTTPDAASVTAPVDPPFRTSGECATCHSNSPNATAMRDFLNNPIAPFDLWQSSMMANSARDPYWRAAVSAEIATTPSRRSEIFAKCMRCHTPMASADGRDTEFEMSFELLDRTDRLGDLARDGVSCTVCHTIAPDGLGTPATYTGNFQTNIDDEIYGPHSNLIASPMFSAVQLNAVPGPHILESSLCASCHTLFTEPTDPSGAHTGAPDFPEQTPYFEWRNSIYTTETPTPGPDAASCQDCHVPRTDALGIPISTSVARNPNGGDYPFLQPRSFGRHLFVGGNTLMPQILRDNATALGATASTAAFDATIAATRDQLQNRTATVSIASATRSGAQLQVDVKIENECGHKFPSGYPARRAWLRLTVRDASSNVVFVSGAFDSSGQLLDSSGAVQGFELAGGSTNPHLDLITNANQVQTYNVLLHDSNNQLTWRLLQAASHGKDNRLLPRGWSASHPDAQHTMPVGTSSDTNFAAGEDTVSYDVLLANSNGPFTVEAELFYQSIMPRHVAELATVTTPEITAFLGYYNAANKTPERIGGATTNVP